jgi:hypothetical protein
MSGVRQRGQSRNGTKLARLTRVIASSIVAKRATENDKP